MGSVMIEEARGENYRRCQGGVGNKDKSGGRFLSVNFDPPDKGVIPDPPPSRGHDVHVEHSSALDDGYR